MEIRLDHIVKTFDTTKAVNDVSLEIAKGELFFLLGPSGCGKTTCLRIIAGFYQPDAGRLMFGDRVMNGVPPHKRNTGMVFQKLCAVAAHDRIREYRIRSGAPQG